jgi:hypothetical protein
MSEKFDDQQVDTIAERYFYEHKQLARKLTKALIVELGDERQVLWVTETDVNGFGDGELLGRVKSRLVGEKEDTIAARERVAAQAEGSKSFVAENLDVLIAQAKAMAFIKDDIKIN